MYRNSSKNDLIFLFVYSYNSILQIMTYIRICVRYKFIKFIKLNKVRDVLILLLTS